MLLSATAFDAYDVLFGAGASVPNVSREQLVAAARTAFKRRALATHPDRASVLGRTVDDLTAEFRRVRAAYESLLAALEGRAEPELPTAPAPTPTPPSTTASARASHRPTELPKRPLWFGEFLYHAGCIELRELSRAVAWQRAQRPRFGEMAVWFGYLTPREVDALIAERRRDRAVHVPLGVYAIRRGVLTSLQCATIASAQRRKQRPIGAYFVEQGRVGPRELGALLAQHRAHQRRHGAK